MKKRIVVVEGPAGSGKSTLLSSLQRCAGVVIPRPKFDWITEARDYETQGPLFSLARDDEQMTRALWSADPLVYLDRWLLAQLVYEGIRQDKPGTRSEHVETIQLHLRRVVQSYHALRSRGRVQHLEEILIHWIILLPGTLTLRMLRSTGNQDYPFDPYTELKHYRLLASDLSAVWPPERTSPPIYATATSIEGVYDEYEKGEITKLARTTLGLELPL